MTWDKLTFQELAFVRSRLKDDGNGFYRDFRTVDTNPYFVQVRDHYLSVNSTLLAIAVVLPAAGLHPYRVIQIKDGRLNCAANNITIMPDGADLVECAPVLVMNVNGDFVCLVSDGVSNWEVC